MRIRCNRGRGTSETSLSTTCLATIARWRHQGSMPRRRTWDNTKTAAKKVKLGACTRIQTKGCYVPAVKSVLGKG